MSENAITTCILLQSTKDNCLAYLLCGIKIGQQEAVTKAFVWCLKGLQWGIGHWQNHSMQAKRNPSCVNMPQENAFIFYFQRCNNG